MHRCFILLSTFDTDWTLSFCQTVSHTHSLVTLIVEIAECNVSPVSGLSNRLIYNPAESIRNTPKSYLAENHQRSQFETRLAAEELPANAVMMNALYQPNLDFSLLDE